MSLSSMPRLHVARWFDPVLAGVLAIAAEIEMVAAADRAHDRVGALVLAGTLLAAATLPLARRRQAPLAVACITVASVIVLALTFSEFNELVVPDFVALIAPYSAAAYQPRGRALVGLVAWVAGACAVEAISPPGNGSLLSAVGLCVAAWAAGRALRARRVLVEELQRTTDLIAAERKGREHLAIAEERTRIARELQTLVAQSVSVMVMHSQSAQRLVDTDAAAAGQVMSVVDRFGRQALGEMRSILDVLRRSDEYPELAPQPGVGQIHPLIESARRQGHHVGLRVEGEPGPLPGSVDLGLYRVLADALACAHDSSDPAPPVDVALCFGIDDVALDVTAHGASSLGWPTISMRQRVAVCDGTIEVVVTPGSPGVRLAVRMPRAFDGVLA